jgi:ethanolamine ammonia-lyase small subunit
MADNKKKRGGADAALIALGESYEVAYWSKKLKITPAQLKAAVKKVGHSARKVEAYIKEQKHKAADRNLIALSQPHEVRYWSKKFKITPARLKTAVAAAGHSSKNVAAYLARKKTAKKAVKKTVKKAAKKTVKKKNAKKVTKKKAA